VTEVDVANNHLPRKRARTLGFEGGGCYWWVWWWLWQKTTHENEHIRSFSRVVDGGGCHVTLGEKDKKKMRAHLAPTPAGAAIVVVVGGERRWWWHLQLVSPPSLLAPATAAIVVVVGGERQWWCRRRRRRPFTCSCRCCRRRRRRSRTPAAAGGVAVAVVVHSPAATGVVVVAVVVRSPAAAGVVVVTVVVCVRLQLQVVSPSLSVRTCSRRCGRRCLPLAPTWWLVVRGGGGVREGLERSKVRIRNFNLHVTSSVT
jgi:hypothetical protein